MSETARMVEALLFAAAEPLSEEDLAKRLPANAEVGEAIKNADVILSLDWVDLGGAFKTVLGTDEPKAKVIQVTLDYVLHNGWSMDYMALPTVDLLILGRTFLARRFTHEQAVSAIVVSYYWHFVDVVWIGLLATIYLIK